MKINEILPPLIQAFDCYEDREYYKIMPGFFSDYKRLLCIDRIKDWTRVTIDIKELPDELFINGQKYNLIEENE